MLRSLSIRNFALIDRLDVEFAPGLNVLTGETGAGKSIVLDALNLVLGERADPAMVRAGADRAVVDGLFDISGSEAMLALLDSMGLSADEGELLLTREVQAGGKSSARVGGRPVSVAQLRQIGDALVDLHGQHEHQSLLSVPRHLDILDEWGGQRVTDARSACAEAFAALRELEREKASIETDARERARLIDLLSFQVREIEEASLTPGEEAELQSAHRVLANAQRLTELAAQAATALAGDEGSVLDGLTAALRAAQEAAALDERLNTVAQALTSARYDIEEASRDLSRYADAVEASPEKLAQIEERLEILRVLKRKYGDTVEEILAHGRQASDRLAALERAEERGPELDALVTEARARFEACCTELTALRQEAASRFAAAVGRELADLAMERTRFEALVEPAEPGHRGADRVEFVIAPNPGEPLRPLARIASGGEISRVMLAIKSAMARRDPLPTMVFDEIDAGVGGRTASVLAEKLAALAESAQVICITHLAQIAGRAHYHLQVEKVVQGERTVVRMAALAPEERVGELARMLGGASVTEAVVQTARELLTSPPGAAG